MGGRNGLARFMPALWIDCVVSGLMEREVYRWRGGGVVVVAWWCCDVANQPPNRYPHVPT